MTLGQPLNKDEFTPEIRGYRSSRTEPMATYPSKTAGSAPSNVRISGAKSSFAQPLSPGRVEVPRNRSWGIPSEAAGGTNTQSYHGSVGLDESREMSVVCGVIGQFGDDEMVNSRRIT